MPGIAELALGAAPVAGGALLGLVAGNLKGPDFRGMIAADLDLLERIPADDVERRARLQASINQRIDDLVETTARSRALREAAASYGGNWRDIVLFVCAVLFTIVWWHVDHDRANWLVMFIVLIGFCVLTLLYAVRGVLRAVSSFNRGRRS
ncbi:hypothetical protein [Mycolicibacterium thermoresistibile]